MEEAHLVNSPRRVLSFSKRKTPKPVFPDSDSIRSSLFRASHVNGPKPSEVYGFVGSISTVVATVIFLIWAYVPDKLLESIGIYYYPTRYWVLGIGYAHVSDGDFGVRFGVLHGSQLHRHSTPNLSQYLV